MTSMTSKEPTSESAVEIEANEYLGFEKLLLMRYNKDYLNI